MSASAHHPPWGRASDTDPGGTGTIAQQVTLRIFWTEFTADREAITEVLENFGKVAGKYRNMTFPKLRKDGTESRLANVLRGDLT